MKRNETKRKEDEFVFIAIWDHKFMTSVKTVQFLHPLLPFFICPNGSELNKTPPPQPPWTSKRRYQLPPPHLNPLWYSCSISIISSRRFHHIPCPCYSQLFTTKNQFKLNSIFSSKTQANMSHLEC